MTKREITRWKFRTEFARGTGIRVGYVYNKRRGVLEDVIRLQVNSLSTTVDVEMRLDEAVIIAAGLNKVAAQMLIGQLSTPKNACGLNREV